MDVAIVGGGLIGLAIADALARDGARVTVYDRGEPASAASWAGAGMLAPYSEAVDAPFPSRLSQLGAASLRAYPDFVADLRERTGIDSHFRRDGTVHAAFDDAGAGELQHAHVRLREAGIASELLQRDGVLAREPLVGSDVRAGLAIPDEAQVDNRRLGRALSAAARAAGVRIEAGCGEVAVDADDRRVRGIRTGDGYRAVGAVVNAAGAWAASLAGVPPAAVVPVRPVKGQMLALAVPTRLVTALIWAPGVYLVPRSDGRLLVGATVEDDGFDVRVTAGGVHALLAAALRAAPALAAFTVSETWAGIRPRSPLDDGYPVLGATAVDGYFVAAGHYRNGILLTPVTASIVAAAVAGRPEGVLPLAN